MTFDQFWQWQSYVPKNSPECYSVAKQAWEMSVAEGSLATVDCRCCLSFNYVKQRCTCPINCVNASEYVKLFPLQQWRTEDANP